MTPRERGVRILLVGNLIYYQQPTTQPSEGKKKS